MANPTKSVPDRSEGLSLSLTDDPGIVMSFRLIPAGRFCMGARGEHGDEEPVHTVEITQPFYLGIYPVTQKQFAVWRPSHENYFLNSLQHPAEKMSWEDANAFCQWLGQTRSHEIPTGYVAGLPTEAQWEYACRAGTDTEYQNGDGTASLLSAGWFDENSNLTTHCVGQKDGNAFGLFDMHGNVWEWCWDDYLDDAYKGRVDGVRNPVLPARSVSPRDSNNPRVIRGGSSFDSAMFCRAAYRVGRKHGFRSRGHGFRVCLFPDPASIESASTYKAH